MTPADFHAQARMIRFSGARCAEIEQQLAPGLEVQGCTDQTPCGFHRELAEALASAYRAGREGLSSKDAD